MSQRGALGAVRLNSAFRELSRERWSAGDLLRSCNGAENHARRDVFLNRARASMGKKMMRRCGSFAIHAPDGHMRAGGHGAQRHSHPGTRIGTHRERKGWVGLRCACAWQRTSCSSPGRVLSSKVAPTTGPTSSQDHVPAPSAAAALGAACAAVSQGDKIVLTVVNKC